MHQAAAPTIPSSEQKSQVKNFICDEEPSKSAWRIWRNANQPRTGTLYEQMMTTKSEVKSFGRKLRAKQERMTLQARDDMLRSKDERRFNLRRKRMECKKLMVDGTPIIDDNGLLTCWRTHFATLAQSQTSESESGDVEGEVPQMEAMSHRFEDFLLDSPMTSEENEDPRRSGGADSL